MSTPTRATPLRDFGGRFRRVVVRCASTIDGSSSPCGRVFEVADDVVELAAARRTRSGQEAEVLAQLTRAATAIARRGGGVDPRDVAQEAFLRLRSRLASGESLGRGYLWRTAYSVTIDLRRREQAEQRRRAQLAPADASPRPSPESRAAGSEIGVAIHGCVEALPEARRRVVVLHLQGHGVKDVSKLLDAEYKRIENLLHRGLKALRACLEQKGFAP